MFSLYNENRSCPPWLQWLGAALCGAAYVLCCLPSFSLIGRFALQMSLSVVLSLLWSVAFFLVFPRSLRAMGKGLSVFLAAMLAYAVARQIEAQIQAGKLQSWIHTFFYDRPLTVAVVWAMPFVAVLLLRLLLPHSTRFAAFRKDFDRFFRDAVGVFILFYICVLVYCFLLQRRPGGQSGLNLIPFAMIFGYLQSFSYAYESIFYLIGNVLCMFPFGFFYRIYGQKRSLVYTLLTPVLLSLLIEVSQLLLRMGDFDVDDILMNAAGFFIGYWMEYLFDLVRNSLTKGEETSIFSAGHN